MSEDVEENLEVLNSLYRAFTDEANRISLILADLERSKDTLLALKSIEEGQEGVARIVLHIGGHIALLVDKISSKEILVLIGSNVYAEMEMDRALEELNAKTDQSREALSKIQVQIRDLEGRIGSAMAKVQKRPETKSSS